MASAFINRHITRVLAAGGDASTIDADWLDEVDGWLTPEDDLMHWVDPAFGCVKNGSNQLSKVFCLGTTRLPRGGDYTPNGTLPSASVTYSATGLGGVPAWVNGNSTAFGYFGSARTGAVGGANDNSQRYSNIRRKHYAGITFAAVFQKSHTNAICLLGFAEFGGLSLRNASGASGELEFKVGGFSNAWTVTANGASTLANNSAHVVVGTFDGQSLAVKAYVEGVAGTLQTATTNAPIVGGTTGNTDNYFLGAGSTSSKMSLTTRSTTYSRTFSNNEAQATVSGLLVFGTALSPGRVTSLTSLIRARIGS